MATSSDHIRPRHAKNSMKREIQLAVLVLLACATVFSAQSSLVADAAMRGDTSALQRLLKARAEVNAPQADGATAIEWAAYRGDLQMADLLIAAGSRTIDREPGKERRRCPWPPSAGTPR